MTVDNTIRLFVIAAIAIVLLASLAMGEDSYEKRGTK